MQASDVRPLPVLEETLNYLLNLLDATEHPFEVVHDFIFDRTRSIRQDLSMQNIVNDQTIHMFEEMVWISWNIISITFFFWAFISSTYNKLANPLLNTLLVGENNQSIQDIKCWIIESLSSPFALLNKIIYSVESKWGETVITQLEAYFTMDKWMVWFWIFLGTLVIIQSILIKLSTIKCLFLVTLQVMKDP